MPTSFSLAHSRFTAASAPDLREEILAHTGSDEATSSILRSIDRFGSDASIQRYEMVPDMRRRGVRGGGAVAWSVRAIRALGLSEGSEPSS